MTAAGSSTRPGLIQCGGAVVSFIEQVAPAAAADRPSSASTGLRSPSGQLAEAANREHSSLQVVWRRGSARNIWRLGSLSSLRIGVMQQLGWLATCLLLTSQCLATPDNSPAAGKR